MPVSHAHRSNPRDIGVRAIRSASASIRLQEARRFLKAFSPATEVLLLGASRGAVDDLARTIAMERRAIFGLHRLSFTQLAARLAAFDLADRGQAPVSSLGHEALAARAVFEVANDKALEYFSPVSDTPGFPKALARTLLELRLSGVAVGSMAGLLRSGPDLADLLERIEKLMSEIGVSDRASLFETATKTLSPKDAGWRPMPLLLLDVPFESHTEARFLLTLIERSPRVLITVPEGDARTVAYLEKSGVKFQTLERKDDTDLARLSRNLFSAEPPPEHERTGELVWLSAPGEARECVEIARRILKEGATGVLFDEIAILIRSPQQYVGVLEHALARAKIPAFFDRGIRRPHPAGRAFLAILNCATENLSANRFAEYLSLAQVPSLVEGVEKEPTESWVASRDEVFGVLSELARDGPEEKAAEDPQTDANPATAVVAGTLRTPWKWESLLVESAVIGGNDRWARRLDGLREQYLLKISELTDDDPDSSRIPHLQRELQNLEHLRAFALPLIETISGWPDQAHWENWLQYLEGFAKRVLKNPDLVLRVLADLRPMGIVGPVSLTEVRNVLQDRLLSLEVEPPSDRYGRVFVGSPHQARGLAFKVVFLPGLAERLFPQKLREDPLLLDELRHELGTGLPTQADRTEFERLLLRLALGSATDKLYASFPRIEISEARARVPSFYALEIMRAVTGRIPDHQTLERIAAHESQASLAWPAPPDAANAIDDFEHDLSVLRALMRRRDADVKGRAHYMLSLNDCLKRSVTERWARAKTAWSQFDGLVRVTDLTRPFLQTQRLAVRPYSVTALQQYAACPYRFFLSTVYHLAPQEEPEPLQRMDPLTKGRLFHQVQAEFFRALQQANLPITSLQRARILEILDNTLASVAAKYYELLAPAIDRVWRDEIGRMRTDLRVWVNELASRIEWEPWLFEFAIGLASQPGQDPNSRRDPIVIDGRFILRGSVDLVERKLGTNILRVTDHKTSKNRSRKGAIIAGGTQLQPVIYSLAVEAATGSTVEIGRFSYCTTAGGFTDHSVRIDHHARQMGIEVFEIVDRAVEIGMLPPAPADKACAICDFLPVCGPDQERRASGKSREQIEGLLKLRKCP
jgi:ATP-dependent helicase/nuclease subunit B